MNNPVFAKHRTFIRGRGRLLLLDADPDDHLVAFVVVIGDPAAVDQVDHVPAPPDGGPRPPLPLISSL